jgi:Domain of unknown function (DUF4349)
MTPHLGSRRGSRLGLLALVVLLPVLGAACSPGSAAFDQRGNPVPAGGEAGGAVAGPAQNPTTDQSSGGGGQGGAGSGGTSNNGSRTATYDVSRPDLLIIKTGNLSLQVKDIDAGLADASAKIGALGGYVAGSDRKGDGDQTVATATYRIPAASWDSALVALRGLADKVLAEQTQSQDVTGDVVDLGARITNLQATEAALQAIMARATKISDVLDVQTQLTDVRGQIEQLSTQRKHLQDQAGYSTLTVAFSLKPPPPVEKATKNFDPGSEVDKATASLVDVLQALATAGIWFGIVWLPILLALAVIGGIVLLVLRRVWPARRVEVLPQPEG